MAHASTIRTALKARRLQRGFTLVELLVVIAIIGMLIALLLPAVQAAREAARRAQCSNNMRQLGLALHNYYDTWNAFPPGGYRIWPNRGSTLVRLLPFVEQQTLYDLYDWNSPDTPFYWQHRQDGLTLPNGETRFASHCPSVFMCPSDTNHVLSPIDYTGDPGPVQMGSYECSQGPTRKTAWGNCPEQHWARVYSDWRFTDWAQPAGPFIRDAIANWTSGPSGRGGFFCKIEFVTDGLSNCIFMGEVRRDCSERMRVYGWIFGNGQNGLVSTIFPINYDTCRTPEEAQALGLSPCYDDTGFYTAFGFKSRHPNGAHFVMGDGSVQFLREGIDHFVYNQLGHRESGEPAPEL